MRRRSTTISALCIPLFVVACGGGGVPELPPPPTRRLLGPRDIATGLFAPVPSIDFNREMAILVGPFNPSSRDIATLWYLFVWVLGLPCDNGLLRSTFHAGIVRCRLGSADLSVRAAG